MLLISLFLLICLSSSANSFKIWPGKLDIILSEGYQNKDIIHPIQVTNNLDRAINASAEVHDPANNSLTEGYSFIPNVSWIKILPEKLYVPAYSSSQFQLILEIPEDEVPLQHNKSWETWVTISSDQYSGIERGIAFKVELSVKIFIQTPPGKMEKQIQNLYFFFGIFISLIIVLLVIYYIKKKI